MTQIDSQLIRQALQTAQATAQKPIERLEQLSGLDAQQFVAALGATLHYATINLAKMRVLEPAFDLLSFSDCIQNECVLLRDAQGLSLVIANIYHSQLEDWAAQRVQAPFACYLAHHSDIAAYLMRHEENVGAIQNLGVLDSANTNIQALEELSLQKIESDLNPVIKLVRSTLFDALKADASDIHLENTPSGLVIKYRLDGVLSKAGIVNDIAMAEQVISRIKVLSELDITEQRVPQDGRFRSRYRQRDIDFRVSIMPGVHGEDAVIRVLDKQTLAEKAQGLNLDALGFDESTKALMRSQFFKPFGMVLVTGPTGSGKTTTLYAAISEINSGQDKIITIEDPVEYQLPGVLQIPVNEKKGLTFSRGLRSILRHDPDRIMVGEIRDAETAQIAVQSALTGHLVFTTVHANNVFDVIGRFLNMGVDAYSFVSALNVIIAQRLLRVVCKKCAQPLSDAEKTGISKPLSMPLVNAVGCGACRGTGYRGRRAVAEVLILDDELRELIVNRASVRQIKALAQQKGTLFLHDAAMAMASIGETTLAEVTRVAPMA